MSMSMHMDMPKTSNHGFYVLGESADLCSHIPMFMDPHQAQLFLEVKITPDGKDPAKVISDDRKKTGASEYVLVSDPLQLPTLAPDAPNRRQSFTGKVYRGWPFDAKTGGISPTAPVVLPAVTVHVTRPIYYRSFAGGAKPLDKLSYYTFCTAEARYLAHVITRPPDFDHILKAEVDGLGAKHDKDTVELEFPGVTNTIAHKLAPDHRAQACLVGTHHEVKLHTDAALIYDSEHLAKAM
jgi:hypothetical protein